MKHFTKILTLGLLASPFIGSAQVNVSTAVSKRKAVTEEFTGNYCTYCPTGHKVVNDLMTAYPGQIIPVKIQHGQYAGTDPIFGGNLQTPDGNTVANYIELNGGWPQLVANRVNGTVGVSYTAWENLVKPIINQNSPVNMYAEATLDASTRLLNVSVEYYYTASEANSTNYLHIGYYQDNMAAYQYNSNSLNPADVYISDVELYKFNHAYRGNLTPLPSSGTWGEVISSTTFGSTDIVNKSITLPASFNGFEVEPGAIKVFAYISKSDKGEIITGVDATPVYSNFATGDNARAIYFSSVNDEKCVGYNGSANAKILVENYGGNDLTSFSTDYSVNGGATSSKPWTGTLKNSEKTTVTLPGYSFTYQSNNTYSATIVNPNGNADETPSDNAETAAWTGSTRSRNANTLRIEAKVDKYGKSEDSWKLRNGAGAVIYQAAKGQLANSTTTIKTFTLPSNTTDCYQFELLDTYGDGWGSGSSFKVFSDATNTLLLSVNGTTIGSRLTIASEFVSTVSTNDIELDNSLMLYPNPTNGVSTLEFTVTETADAKIDVLNTLGQVVFTKSIVNANGTQKVAINSDSFENGLYLVNVTVGDKVSTKKLTVTK